MPSTEELSPGATLDRYTLIRRIALGGMAEIWLAHEKKADGREEPLALKVLLAPYAKDPTFRSMFADEVRIASRLTHENIVTVFGALELEGHLIQAMELVDGKDLRRVLSTLARQGHRFPTPLALLISREVARALSYAHTKRRDDGKPLEIVHRDISPHNVMITFDGGVKLLDFGIAKAAERLTKTRTGIIKGKIAYMAPEQAIGADVTAKTDIFAMGIVLWEMLAMQRLFKADSDAQVMNRVIHADVPPIKDYNPDLPDEVTTLLKQMLAQRAVMRPDSARTVENAITRILLRHYDEGDASRDALAAWSVQFMEDEKRTGQFMAPDLMDKKNDNGEDTPLEPLDASLLAEIERAANGQALSGPVSLSGEIEMLDEIDRTMPDAMPLPAGDATVATSIREDAKTIAMPIDASIAPPPSAAALFALSQPSSPKTPSSSKADTHEDRTTDPVRLPTRSEIQRAVDAVPTMPVVLDDSGRKSPAKSELKVRDQSSSPMHAVAVPTPMSVPMAMRPAVHMPSGSQDATSLGELSPVNQTMPVELKVEAPPRPKVVSDPGFRFEPMKVGVEEPIRKASSSPARPANDPLASIDPKLEVSGPSSLPPSMPSAPAGKDAHAANALRSLRTVLIAGGVAAAIAIVLVIGALMRSC